MKDSVFKGVTALEAAKAMENLANMVANTGITVKIFSHSISLHQPILDMYAKRDQQKRQVKKRFSIFLLLMFSLFVQAQSQDIGYLKNLNKCDENFARQFSDLVANNCKTKYQFYGIVKSVKRSTYTIVYIPENSTEAEKQNIKEFESTKEYQDFEYPNCLSVHFYTFNDGENIDFQIKGVEKLKFHTVKSKYLNIFPTWKTLFDPTADVENTLKVFSPKYENIQNKLKFYLKKNNDLWEINNWSN